MSDCGLPGGSTSLRLGQRGEQAGREGWCGWRDKAPSSTAAQTASGNEANRRQRRAGARHPAPVVLGVLADAHVEEGRLEPGYGQADVPNRAQHHLGCGAGGRGGSVGGLASRGERMHASDSQPRSCTPPACITQLVYSKGQGAPAAAPLRCSATDSSRQLSTSSWPAASWP